MGVESATDARAQIIEEQFWAVVANIPGAVYRCACGDDWPIRFIRASRIPRCSGACAPWGAASPRAIS
jgi:hypothetical protein